MLLKNVSSMASWLFYRTESAKKIKIKEEGNWSRGMSQVWVIGEQFYTQFYTPFPPVHTDPRHLHDMSVKWFGQIPHGSKRAALSVHSALRRSDFHAAAAAAHSAPQFGFRLLWQQLSTSTGHGCPHTVATLYVWARPWECTYSNITQPAVEIIYFSIVCTCMN